MHNPGKRLEHIMVRLKLNQLQMADLLEVSHATIVRWLSLEKVSRTLLRRMDNLNKVHQVNLD